MKRSFEEWMEAVNRAVENIVGCSADDLPDYCYRDEYDAGTGPSAAAVRAIREAGF